MAELLSMLLQRKSVTETKGESWESQPTSSTADASQCAEIKFDNLISAQEFLRALGEDPEEDLLSEALAEVLKVRGCRPQHSLAHTDEDAERLKGIAEALALMQGEFALERDKLSEVREEQEHSRAELQKREADILSREKELDAARAEELAREEARKSYPQPAWLGNVDGTINVAVVGNAGVGKSLLINKLRRVRPGSADWAPVGVKETTMRPSMYKFANEERARLWDLPGAGTQAFPSETYISRMGLRYFDAVIIATAGRFTTTEMKLRAELMEYYVPYFMVRTKVDIDIWNNKEDNGKEEVETLKSIRDDLIRKHEVANPYLVSSRDADKYDMPQLLRDVFPGLQRQLDGEAPVFSPSENADSSWAGAWTMPVIYEKVLAGIQGRWQDEYGAVYIIHGTETHVTLKDGQTAVVELFKDNERVWWCNKWYVDDKSIISARHGNGELSWSANYASTDKPLRWWWVD